jgi:hypothetical protein
MKIQGFPWKGINYLTGIHDFEQYYVDIFRKCFVQAHKHQEYAEIFISYWPQQVIMDFDYKIALKGFIDGIDFEGDVHIDTHQEIYRELFEKLQIVEKSDIPPGYFSPSDIELLVKNWIEPPIYHKYIQYEMISQENEGAKQMTRKKKLIEKKRTLGLFKLFLYIFGWGLEKVGGKIKRLVDTQEELHP